LGQQRGQRFATQGIHRGGETLYGALRKGVDAATDSIEDFQRNVRKAIRTREEEAQRFGERIANSRSEL